MANQAVLQAMANLQQQAIPINNQSIMGAQGQSPTIISGQGLYIRAANPLQGQQGILIYARGEFWVNRILLSGGFSLQYIQLNLSITATQWRSKKWPL